MKKNPRVCAFLVVLTLIGCAGDGEESSGTQEGSPATLSLAQLEEIVRQRPDDIAARQALARALHDAGRKNEAVEQFQRVVEADPSERALLDLALAHTSIARFEDAQAGYERLLTVSPEHPIALHNLGNLALTRGDTDEAIGLYRRAIQARPNYLLAYSHLGDALRQAGAYEEAFRSYETVLTLEPTNPTELAAFDDALYNRAMLDLEMGATERAVRSLVELLRANPDHPRAHYGLGQAFQRLGRPDEAQREFEAHMALMSKNEPSAPVATRE